MAKPTLQQALAIESLTTHWSEAANISDNEKYGPSEAAISERPRNATRADIGNKFAHLIIGTSSAFLVEIETGIIYGDKGWLKVDRKKIIGNAYDPAFDAAALVRDRFRYGHFENNSDGSLRQPIVRR